MEFWFIFILGSAFFAIEIFARRYRSGAWTEPKQSVFWFFLYIFSISLTFSASTSWGIWPAFLAVVVTFLHRAIVVARSRPPRGYVVWHIVSQLFLFAAMGVMLYRLYVRG